MNGKDWKERAIESARDSGIDADNPLWKKVYELILAEARRLEELRCVGANVRIDGLQADEVVADGAAWLI